MSESAQQRTRDEIVRLMLVLDEQRGNQADAARLNALLRDDAGARCAYLAQIELIGNLRWDRLASPALPAATSAAIAQLMPSGPESQELLRWLVGSDPDPMLAKAAFLAELWSEDANLVPPQQMPNSPIPDMPSQPTPVGHLGWLTSALPVRLLALGLILTLTGYFVVVMALIPLARWAESMRGAHMPPVQQLGPTGDSHADRGHADTSPGGLAATPLGQHYQLKRGRSELRLAGGTRVVLEGPATWQLETDRCLHLDSGKLTAHVPPAAIGFTVVTPVSTIVDLGTEFGVEVDDKGITEMHVLAGEVAIAATAAPAANVAPRTTRVKAGQAVQVSANRAGTSEIRFDPRRFESARPVTSNASFAPADTIPIANPSFEEQPAAGFPMVYGNYTADIPGWTVGNPAANGGASSNGLSLSSEPFADNGLIPQGARVTFIQSFDEGPHSLIQRLPALTAGVEYTLSFAYNARAVSVPPSLTVTLGDHKLLDAVDVPPVGGDNPYHAASVTFTADAADAAGPMLTIVNAHRGGDSALLIDNFSLKINELTPTSSRTVPPPSK